MADTAFLDLARVRATGRRAILATVVRGVGPTYRRPGTSAVICEDGEIIGAISGGCLESDVLEAAAAIFAGGEPRLLDYDTASPEDLIWGTGTGCGGRVEILLAPVEDELLSAIVASLRGGRAAVLATVLAGEERGRRTLVQRAEGEAFWYEGDGTVFCQRISPPTMLLICGAGDDCRPVASLAASLGMRVAVVDHRPAWATAERFPWAEQLANCPPAEVTNRVEIWPGSYAVILSHQYARDLEYLQALLPQPLAYLGLLGSRTRSAELLRELIEQRPDLKPAVAEKLRAPVGLDIGSDGPQEIALAILAEILAHRSGRPGTPLVLGH